MNEELIQFIKEQREAFVRATGHMPNDDAMSRYALAFQIEQLNSNIETYLVHEGMLEEINEELEHADN